ncbi:MAG TPA: hypothetical protein VGR62_07760 [Candidatus Binatia bacterium]|nr:hypothetical protein [Candidatus Binatia bacterium]
MSLPSAPIAQTADGYRVLFAENAFPQSSSRGMPDAGPERAILDFRFDPPALDPRKIDIGSAVPSTSRGIGALTDDGGALYFIGTTGLLGAPEVKVVHPARERVDPIDGTRLRPLQLALGDSCPDPIGCFCQTDADCDDGNGCTIDTCDEATRCRYRPRRCIGAVQCLYDQDDRGDIADCYSDGQQRRMDRARDDIDDAAAALERGDKAAARTRLDRAEQRVTRLLAGAIKRVNDPSGNDPRPECNSLVFQQQLALLRGLRTVKRGVSACVSRAR